MKKLNILFIAIIAVQGYANYGNCSNSSNDDRVPRQMSRITHQGIAYTGANESSIQQSKNAGVYRPDMPMPNIVAQFPPKKSS